MRSTTANKEQRQYAEVAWYVTTMLNCRHLCCPCKGEGRDYSRMRYYSKEVFGEHHLSHDKEPQIRGGRGCCRY